MFDVKGKSALITGGTAGIGLATAERLRSAGARVAIVGRRAEGAAIAKGLDATFIQADLADEAQLTHCIRQAHEALGALDIVFNNAGIENTGPTIEESNAAEFSRLLAINLTAAYSVLHHASPLISDGGSVINTSSAAGLTQMPGYSQYSASKAAIVSLTKSAALEFAPRRIRVNAICPGSIWSEMLYQGHPEVDVVKTLCPLERIGEAEEVAALVHFLASDDSRYITGAAIPIDGGILAGFSLPTFKKMFGED
jgi:NAD(P)-dependent dehydrogenase (short-subunit alcohol dehydrogenase family)